MLDHNEWEFMNELVQILSGFEELTRKFSGNSYVTFSVVHPSICSLKDRLKSILNPAEEEEYEEYIVSELNQIEEDSEIMQLDNENELLLNIENIPDNEHADEVIIAVPGTRKKVNISNPINTNNLKIQILKILLTSIDKYWNFSSELSSVSSILDPRLKRLNHLSSTKKNKAKWLLESEFQSLKNNQEPLASTSTIPSCSAHSDSETIATPEEISIFNQIFQFDDDADDNQVNAAKLVTV